MVCLLSKGRSHRSTRGPTRYCNSPAGTVAHGALLGSGAGTLAGAGAGVLEIKCPFNRGNPLAATPPREPAWFYMPQVGGLDAVHVDGICHQGMLDTAGVGLIGGNFNSMLHCYVADHSLAVAGQTPSAKRPAAADSVSKTSSVAAWSCCTCRLCWLRVQVQVSTPHRDECNLVV